MTNADIEYNLYTAVKALTTGEEPVVAVSGGVYYKGMRPFTNDPALNKEDIVVSVLAGKGSDLLEGNCLVNVYVQDVQAISGMYYENKARTLALSQTFDTIVPMLNNANAIHYERLDTIAVVEEPDTHEHLVSLKLRFRVLNTNY